MAHQHRFYVPPDTDAQTDRRELELPPEEAHHALRVARVREGDAVVLFEGCGREFDGVVGRAQGRSVVVQVSQVRRIPPPPKSLTLVQAWLNHEKSVDDLIRHGTALGIAEFRFFKARRSERGPRIQDRWQRIAVEACKQCGRPWLPKFVAAADLKAALPDTAADSSPAVTPTRLIATQAVEPTPLRQAISSDHVELVIGPEGDFTPDELETARDSGATPISLGNAILRSELAALAAGALILYKLGQLGPTVVKTPDFDNS